MYYISSSAVIHTSVLFLILLFCTVLYCTQESSAVRRDEGAIKEVVGRQRFIKSREIIEMIESGYQPMDKVHTSRQPDFPNS